MPPIVRIAIMLPIGSGILVEKSCRTLGIIFQVTTSAVIPIGRLIRKIHRQLSDVSRPPRTGPIAPGGRAAHRPQPHAALYACWRHGG